MEKVNVNEVKTFYDDFTAKQKQSGVNSRHRYIMKRLRAFGLNRNTRILEIGCGIGTLTSLLAKHVNQGSVLATDISPGSIDMARTLNKNHTNIEFLVSDMTDFKTDRVFDWVILPDVLEHIPVEQHRALFAVIRKHMHVDSTIFINIPNPRILEWLHKHQPEALQIIDQPLYTDKLLQDIYANDLYLDTLVTYALSYEQPDYQYLVVRPNKPLDQVAVKSGFRLMMQSLLLRLGINI